MVDNRPDTRVSMRTALARAKGLGPAGHGVEHWWLHRMLAVSNLPLIVAFVIIVVGLVGRSHAEALAIVSQPLVAIVLVLCVVSVVNHMRLGMQIVIDDYVHDKGWKIVVLIANNFFAAVIATVCLYSVLKISFGWIR
jgi:succinate dehydrogenase / fumarate reductase membrane anchor subunit